MNLSSMLNKKLIFLNYQFNSYQEIIQFISDKFSEIIYIPSSEIKESLMRRENIGTTFLGHFLALPHGYLNNMNDIHILFIRLENPMSVTYDYQHNNIKYIFAVLTSTKKAQTYLKVLSSIAQLVTTNSYILDNAKSATDLIETIERKNFSVDEHLTATNLISYNVNINKEETVGYAVDIMKKKEITFLPVTNWKNELLGIIDLADILSATFHTQDISSGGLSLIHELKTSRDLLFEPIQRFWENEEKHFVGDIMRSPDTYTVLESASYTDIVFLMTKYHHRFIVVIDDNNIVKGLIDTDDIVHKMIRV